MDRGPGTGSRPSRVQRCVVVPFSRTDCAFGDCASHARTKATTFLGKSFGKGRGVETIDFDRWCFELEAVVASTRHGEINHSRHLGGDSVIGERRNQAGHRLRSFGRDNCQIRIAELFRLRQPIEPTGNALATCPCRGYPPLPVVNPHDPRGRPRRRTKVDSSATVRSCAPLSAGMRRAHHRCNDCSGKSLRRPTRRLCGISSPLDSRFLAVPMLMRRIWAISSIVSSGSIVTSSYS
jgi:hypothetical protein